MASSVHQRRNPRESLALSSSAQLSTNNNNVPPAIATVRRRKWGTSAFDENWLNLDCCGLFCAFFTYCLHMYGCYAVCFILIPPWMSYVAADGIRSLTAMGHFHRFAFCSVAAMAIASHFKAMTTDPGAVPPDAIPLPDPSTSSSVSDVSSSLGEEGRTNSSAGGSGTDISNGQTEALIPKHRQPQARGRRLCRRCNSYKPQRAHHCSVCKRCIIKMDHHCPWVNNCVGIGNHKYFLLFIFYTCLSCVYSLCLVTSRFLVCLGHHSASHGVEDAGGDQHHHHHSRLRNMHCLDEPTHLLNIVGLVVESILFGLFTTCMMVDQWDVVTTSMTHIDRLKGGDLLSMNSNKERVSGTIEVFGMGPTLKRAQSKFRSDWLSPFANVCFPESVRDDIYGFCRSCTNSNGGGGSNKKTLDSSLELGKIGSDIV